MTMNIKETERKIGFINDLIKSIEIATEADTNFYSKRRQFIVNFFPLSSLEDQRGWLKDLKKKKIISGFKEANDCFYVRRAWKFPLYGERQKLLELVNPPKKTFEETLAQTPGRRLKKDNLLLVKDLEPETEIKGLAVYSDGSIRYKSEVVPVRTQLKTLCWLFMRHPNRLLTPEDIRDEIVRADRRKSVPRITIAKYVSELHNLLKLHFKKEVIFNQQQEGWYFKP